MSQKNKIKNIIIAKKLNLKSIKKKLNKLSICVSKQTKKWTNFG